MSCPPPTNDAKAAARDAIAELVKEFRAGEAIFRDARKFDEAKVRAGFLDPFFEALGWPVKDSQRRVGKAREVVVEDRAGIHDVHRTVKGARCALSAFGPLRDTPARGAHGISIRPAELVV